MGGIPYSTEEYINQLIHILKEMYLIRMVNFDLKWNMSWVKINRYISHDTAIEFDTNRYIHAYLNANGRLPFLEKFYKAMDNNRSRLIDDYRCCIRGHDISELLYHSMHKLKGKNKFRNKEILGAVLKGCVELNYLRSEPLFQKLAQFGA